MTRRAVLAQTLALAGLGAGVKAQALPPPPVPVWNWLGTPVTAWKIEVVPEVGGWFYSTSGTTREGFDRARADVERVYPLAAGHCHRELLTLAR